MFRKHENPDALKAGLMAFLVHALLLAGLFFSFNWKAAHQNLNVTEVELWDKVPAKSAPPKPELRLDDKPAPPKDEPRVEPKDQPKPEPKPDIQAEQKMREEAEIALKKEQKAKEAEKLQLEKEKQEKEKVEKQKLEKEKQEKIAKEKALEQVQREAREEELLVKKQAKKEKQDALKRLQQEMLGDENANNDKATQAANTSAVAEYTDKIKAKIRGNVNKTLCGDGNPELLFNISVLPTGDLSGSPKLKQSSGSGACDEAVERAIIASQPLPLPNDAALKARFRQLNLKFRPND